MSARAGGADRSRPGLMAKTRTVNIYIDELIKAGKLRPLVPGKPNSPKQRYISVEQGELRENADAER